MLQPKRNLFLKGHWENFKIGGVLKLTKINSMKEKQCFMLCLEENEIKSKKKVYILLVHLLSKSFPNKLSGTVFFVFVLE